MPAPALAEARSRPQSTRAAAYLLVLLAYQRAPASPVATIRELSILLGILLARERPGWRVWAGGALCVLGAALTAL